MDQGYTDVPASGSSSMATVWDCICYNGITEGQMPEIPAEWLEKSAANAAKKMKPDPNYGSGTAKGPVMRGSWLVFDCKKRGDWEQRHYLAVMRTLGGGIVVRGVRHEGDGRWYYLNTVAITNDLESIKYLCKADFNIPNVK